MASIEERIYSDLAPVGVPVFEQGQWTGGELPQEFITYYFSDSTDIRHYDNMPALCEQQAQVNIYATDPARIDVLRGQVFSALLSQGWTRQGRGYAGELDDETQRAAWFMVFYLTTKEEV